MNSIHMLIEGEKTVHESSQSNIHAQEDVIDTNEGDILSNSTGITFSFTSLRFCQKKMLPSEQGKKLVMQLNPSSPVFSFKQRNLCLRPRRFMLNIQSGT